MIQPHYEKLAPENTNVQFLEVDVDELHDVAQKEQIRAMVRQSSFSIDRARFLG